MQLVFYRAKGNEMLSIEERYELFKNTIEECGTDILSESEEVIEYKLFDEFAVDAISFLHENMLDALLKEGMVEMQRIKELLFIYAAKLFIEMRKRSEEISRMEETHGVIG